MKKIGIIGDGAWGTALATLFAHNDHTVYLWCYNAHVAHTIETKRENGLFLPGVLLHKQIIPTTDLALVCQQSEVLCQATPVVFLRSIIVQAKKYLLKNSIPWIIYSKGIEQNTLLFSADIIADVLEQSIDYCVAVGPSFARELAQQQETGFTLSANNITWAQSVRMIMSNHFVTAEISNDIIGVQLWAALKNVIALGIGILDGAQYGNNTKALFFTRMVQELTHIVTIYGGNQETILNLCGIGDMVLTSYSTQSKNVQLGMQLGKGIPLEKALAQSVHIPESINTIAVLKTIIATKNLNLPVSVALINITLNQYPIKTIIDTLMHSTNLKN